MECKYVCQVRLSIIRQIEFTDIVGLPFSQIEQSAKDIVAVEISGVWDEVSLMNSETTLEE